MKVAARPLATASALAAAALAAGAAPTGAAPPDQTVVYEEHTVWEPFSEEQDWPCLGEEGTQDDAVVVSGLRRRLITVTAAGGDPETGFVAPYAIRFNEGMDVTIDPDDPDLPVYQGSLTSVFRASVDAAGEHAFNTARFTAVAPDGSAITFRFHFVLLVTRDGEVRIDRRLAECRVR